MELWRRIVDRVNAVGQHPRTRDDIRKKWNDLRGKVRSVVARHHIAVQRTGGGPPPPSPQLTTWEEQVLVIMHPEGLAGVAGGLDSGDPGTNTGQAAGEPAAAGRTVPGDQGGPEGIHTTLVTIAGVLADMANTMREALAHQRAPDTSQTEEQPSTSADASGQKAPPQEQQATSSTQPPVEGEPPRKRSLLSRQKPENIAKTPVRKYDS
ncbi:hypothetical protein NDU88_003071 [Pleurodeles waltl]|uniref:Myb/SANT-like DNA-binding domain-containing protein n=1 Tax=Pleurodeles waltl TaxID=8319 RepID=A0AAV7W3Y6_PLEWA|nr:hypothetical protein NDU88_003071 [Pleurodeles waltl]